MKKRLVSTMLILCMVLSLLPTNAMAINLSPETEQKTLPLLSADAEPESTIPEFVPGVVPEEYHLVYPSSNGPAAIADTTPAQYDTRNTYQTSIKNQGSNGLCWTFGSYAALEANAKKNGMGDLDFSELHMGYSTSNQNGNDLQGWDRSPGDGGNRYYSSAYLMRGTTLSGTVDEAADPYVTTVLQDRALSITESKEQSYTVQNILFLTDSQKAGTDSNVIKQAIQIYGGVGASMYSDQTTADANSSIDAYFNTATNSYYYNRNTTNNNGNPSTNHLVEIVGWDDNYPASNFTIDPGANGAWMVKNSWGDSWGDDGYFWISYKDTNFPLSAFCFDGIKPYDSSATVYETDYKFSGRGTGVSSAVAGTTRTYARVYTSQTDNEKLTSVRVFVDAADATVSIDCIAGFTAVPTGYSFTAKGSKEIIYPGWYTIDFDEPVDLGAINQFAVIVQIELNSDGGLYKSYDDSSSVGASPAYDISNSSWTSTDLNYCIKAVTKPADESKATADKAASELTWDTIRGENEEQTKVRTDLTLPTSFKYGTTITWASTNTAIAQNGAVTRPVGDTNTTGVLTATITKDSATVTKTFELTVIAVPEADNAAVTAVANSITWDTIKGENIDKDDITKALNLSTSAGGDVAVTWQSSNTDIINVVDITVNNGNEETVLPAGSVRKPRFDKINTVTLTAKVTKGEAEQNVKFELTVPRRAESTEDVAAAIGEWFREDWSKNWWSLIQGANKSYSSVRYDLVVPQEITFPMERGGSYTVELYDINPVDISDTGTANSWLSVVDNTGEVTRPAYGQPDSKGYFRLRISCGDGYIYYMASVAITVLSYKGELTVHVENAEVEAGNIAGKLTAKVTQTGNPGEITYQWYQADGSNATAIPGATAADFSIPTELTVGTYNYYCEVSALDARMVQSNVATVNVTAPDNTAATVTLTANPASTTYGNSVMLTATVNDADENPVMTGSVQFKKGGEAHGSAVPVTGGTAATTLTDLNAGSHSFTAEYISDSGEHRSTSKDVTVEIAKATPGIEVSLKEPSATIYTSTDPSTVELVYTGTPEGSVAWDGVTGFTAGPHDYDWVFTPDDTANYNPVTGSISIIAVAIAIDNIEVKTNPTKMTYAYGETFDPAGMVITVTYNNNVTKDISYSGDSGITISGSLGAAGTHTITVGYEGKTVEISITVTAKSLTDDMVTLASDSYTYTGAAIQPAVTVLDNEKKLIVDTDYTVWYADNTNAGTAKVTVTGQGNYSGSINKTFVIAKAEPTITVSLATNAVIYTTTRPADVPLTYSGEPKNGTVVWADSVISFAEGANDYGWVFTTADPNYHGTTGMISVTAQIAEVTGIEITTEPENKTYTYGQAFDPTGMVITVTYADGKTTTIGTPYTGVTFSELGDAGGNKTVIVTYAGKEATITGITVNKKQITVSGIEWNISRSPFTYDGTEKSVSLSGDIPNGVNITKRGDTGTVVGKYTATAEFTAINDTNYEVTGGPITADWEIVQGEPSHENYFTTLKYDDTTSRTVSKNDFGITVDGLFALREGAAIINGDRLKDGHPTISSDSLSISFALAADGTVPDKAVTIEIPLTFTPTDENYKAIDVTLSIIVAGKTPVTLTTREYSMTYNGSTITLDEIKDNLTASVEGTWTFAGAEEDLPKDAGTYQVGVVFTPEEEGQYEGGTREISITIEPAEITVTAEDKSVEQGGTMPMLTYTVSGLVGSDTWVTAPAISCAAVNTATVGSFEITVSGGDAGGNYTVSYVNGTLTVTASSSPTKETVILSASAYARTYNGRAVTLDEIRSNLSSSAAGTWAFVNASGLPKNAGTYQVGLTFTPDDQGRYTGGTAVISITIRPATITVTAESKKVAQNDAMPTLTYTASGLIGSDTWVTAPTVACAVANTATAGSFEITVSGGDAGGNYTVSYVNGTLTVTASPAPAKEAVILSTKAYTGTYNGSAITLADIEGNLSSSAAGTWAFVNASRLPKNAGTYQVKLTFTPADTAKYEGGNTTIGITINKALITVTADDKTVEQNDAMPTLTYTVSGLIGSDTWVTAPTVACAAANTTTAGSFEITVSGGDAGGNYTVSHKNATLTVTAAATPPVHTGETTQSGTAQTTATPAADINGSNATATVDATTASQIVQQAVENDSNNVVIAPVVTGDVTRTAVTIPANTVGEIGRSTGADLTVSTPVATVVIPNTGLNLLSVDGDNVTVIAERSGSTMDFTVTSGDRVMSDIPGGVTLEVPMARTTPGTVAVLIHEDGTREVIRKSVTDGGSISIPLSGSARVEIMDNSKTFSDVAPDNWAFDAVAFASSHELFNGTGTDTFSPDLSMTRGMLAVVLHNLENNPSTDFQDVFVDVRDDAWYAEGVSWAASNGIVNGYGDGSFGVNDPITREQLAVMLWRYAGEPAVTGDLTGYPDAGDVHESWAGSAMVWAVQNGIINGSDGKLEPQGNALRSQAAAMFMRFCENIKK